MSRCLSNAQSDPRVNHPISPGVAAFGPDWCVYFRSLASDLFRCLLLVAIHCAYTKTRGRERDAAPDVRESSYREPVFSCIDAAPDVRGLGKGLF